MAEKIINVKLKTASDTQSNWESKNTTLLDGELAYDKTKKNLKIGDGTTAWNNLPYLIPEVETPIIEISGITQELLTNGSKMGAFTSEQVAQIVKAKGFIVSDTAVGRNYYFKIQLSASGGVYVLSCESNTDVSSNDLILCLINGTNWMAQIQLGKRFTEAIYNELKASGGGSQEINTEPIHLALETYWYEYPYTYSVEGTITLENYNTFLENKNAPIEFEGKVYQLEFLNYVEDENGGYEARYSYHEWGREYYIQIWWDQIEPYIMDYYQEYYNDKIYLNGTINGWEENFSVDLNITLTENWLFLENYKNSIQIEDFVFQLEKLTKEDNDLEVYTSHFLIKDNYKYVINIHWSWIAFDNSDIGVVDAYAEKLGGSGSGNSESKVEFIDCTTIGVQWDGHTLNISGEYTSEQYNSFLKNKNAPIIVSSSAFSRVLWSLEKIIDRGNNSYSCFYTHIDNNYKLELILEWSPNGGDVRGYIEIYKAVIHMSAVENDDGSLDSIMSAEEIYVFESNPENVEFLIEDSDWGYILHLTYAFRMDDGTFRYMINDGRTWIYLDIMDWTYHYWYFEPTSSNESSSRAIYTNDNTDTYSVTRTDDDGIATVNLLESNAYYRLDLSTLDYGQEQPAEIRIRFITNDIKGIFNFSHGLGIEILSFELQAGFFINYETLNLSSHVTIYGLFNYFGGQDNNVLMLAKSNAYLEDAIYNIEVDELGMCKVFANHEV